MSYESKGFPSNYLGSKRHKHNLSRKDIGYRVKYLTPLTQRDIVKLPKVENKLAFQGQYSKKPGLISRAVSFIRSRAVSFVRRLGQ